MNARKLWRDLGLRLLRGKRMWSDACSYCKGYPEPEKCYCSTSYRFRRWGLRHVFRVGR